MGEAYETARRVAGNEVVVHGAELEAERHGVQEYPARRSTPGAAEQQRQTTVSGVHATSPNLAGIRPQ